MRFENILGHETQKEHLINSISQGRIPHAQLFIGPEGCGVLPMALGYARLLLTQGEHKELLHTKMDNFNHPDLHFVFPSIKSDNVKDPKASEYLKEFREFLTETPYGSEINWLQSIGLKNQQGLIRVEDATDIIHSTSLKSFEGGYKVTIIWMAEKMNTETGNKILKILEEPTPKTVFILIAESEENILKTILSRCQVLRFLPLPDQLIADAIKTQSDLNPREALLLARSAQGSYNKALELLNPNANEHPFEEWFITWVRAAFRAKGNAAVVRELVAWSDTISGIGRELQKKFLEYCMEMFRQALLINYQVSSLVYYEPKIEKFKLENFAPFVNDSNIEEIFNEISDAMYHIERNANPKMVFTDLSIKLTRLIHKK